MIGVSEFVVREYEKACKIPVNTYVLKNAIDVDRFNKTISEKERVNIYRRENGRYRAKISGKNIGTYDTKEEAISEYKKAYKEKWRGLVLEYKNKIPYNIFEILINAV